MTAHRKGGDTYDRPPISSSSSIKPGSLRKPAESGGQTQLLNGNKSWNRANSGGS